MSGMKVNRAVSSLKRSQAIFSREPSAAVSSVTRISTANPRKVRDGDGEGDGEGEGERERERASVCV
jgi:hypothetical protein